MNPHARALVDALHCAARTDRGRPRILRWRGAAALVLCASIAACGGGGSGGAAEPKATPAATPPAPPPAPQSTLSGKVTPVGTPVTVTVKLVDATQPAGVAVLTATTDADGNFALSAPTSAIPKDSQVAVVVSADGYLPSTLIYSTSTSGDATLQTATNAIGTVPAVPAVTLLKIATGTFSFTGLDQLQRLGDGSASGSINGQLQLPAPPADHPMVNAVSEPFLYNDAGKTTLEVSMLVRGLQASMCPGAAFTLRNIDAGGTEVAKQVLPLIDSPVDGSFLSQSATFIIDPSLVLGTRFVLEVSTGNCGTEYDDMEFVGVTGTLN